MIEELFSLGDRNGFVFFETRKKSDDNLALFHQAAKYVQENRDNQDVYLDGGIHGSAYVIRTPDDRLFRTLGFTVGTFCKNQREVYLLWKSILFEFGNDAGYTSAELCDSRFVVRDNNSYRLDECAIYSELDKPKRRTRKVGGKKKWGKSVIKTAKELLCEPSGDFHELRVHEFHEDEDAHDDDFQTKLEQSFVESFDALIETLGTEFGQPAESGEADHDAIPLTGVFKFACWPINEQLLFAAAAHEDRETPLLLVIGVSE